VKRLLRLLSLGLLAVLLFGSTLTAAAQLGGPNPVLTKEMSPKRPRVGQAARITIVAVNRGTANADNVVITDPLPDNIALAGVATTQGNVNVTHHIITVYVGTLAPGQTVIVTNDVVVIREFANDTPYTNCTGLTFRDGTARLACFPLGPAFDPVSITTPPTFLPEAGRDTTLKPISLIAAGAACLLVSRRLRRSKR
jgi:uncharacterized repeat protein (TIGR01451 family)